MSNDLARRVKHNPFINDAIKILGSHNFHLHRPEFGKNGSVDLIVYMDDRQGREVSKTFNFPHKMDHFNLMRWKSGLRQDLLNCEAQGFRPPRRQFGIVNEVKLPEVFTPPDFSVFTPPDFSDDTPKEQPQEPIISEEPTPTMLELTAHIPELHARKEEPIMTMIVPQVEDELMAVTMSVPNSMLPTLLGVVNGTARLLRVRPLAEMTNGNGDSKKPLPQEPTKPVRMSPPPKKKFGNTPGTMMFMIDEAWPEKTIVNARYLFEKIAPKHPEISKEKLKVKIPQYLADLVKRGKARRVDTGKYQKIG